MPSAQKSHHPGLIISTLLILTFLIYSQVLRHEFVNWDDNTHITDNLNVRSLSFDNLRRIFTSTVLKGYIPLTVLSFALEYNLAGLNPSLYHLNNVFLHLLVVFLVFRLGMALGLKERGAYIASFIFALHPMHVESVAWATERKDVLYSVFYLGAVLWYLRFSKTNRVNDYYKSFLLGFLGMLAKPMALSLPLILLLCDWFCKGSFKKGDWLNKIPYGIFIVPLAWITFSAHTKTGGQNIDAGQLFPFWAGVFYLKKFFWPGLLVPHYEVVLPTSFLEFDYWSTFAIIAAGILVFWVWRNKWFRFSLSWYFLSIFFLLNNDYRTLTQPVADRFMYLPSLGFCFFAGYAVERIWQAKKASSALAKAAILGSLFGIAFCLSIRTFSQIGVWKNSFVLWNHIVERSPQFYLAYNNRGRIYERRGQLDLAMADYEKSIGLNPNFAKAHKNTAMIYERRGDIQSALAAYSKAIQVKPDYSAAYNNRGLLYVKLGKNDSALADYNLAIAADPEYALGYSNRGALFVRLGEIGRGLRDMTYAIRLQPNSAAAYSSRAAVYLRLNLLTEALKDCQTSLRLNGAQKDVLMICSEVCAKMGNYEKALAYARRARQAGFAVDE